MYVFMLAWRYYYSDDFTVFSSSFATNTRKTQFSSIITRSPPRSEEVRPRRQPPHPIRNPTSHLTYTLHHRRLCDLQTLPRP